jgi:hypothetical protein
VPIIVTVRPFASVVAIVAVAAIGATALSGCDTKVGTAGIVNGGRISETTVSGYLTPQAQSVQLTTGQTIAPRSFVLQWLVNTQVVNRVLAHNNISPTPADIDQAQQAALSGATEADLLQELTSRGYKASFEQVYLNGVALFQLLSKVPDVTDAASLEAAMAKAGVTVEINPRYGVWSPTQFYVNSDLAANLPPYLKATGGTSTPTPSPTG